MAEGLEPNQKSSGYAFLDSLVPSYLSIDVSGRVVRLDTFSKTIAPGCRLGWITAQPAFIERITRIAESSTQQPSGFVQSVVAELILGPEKSGPDGRGGAKDGTGWKMDGWVRWLEGLRGEYERRMNTMCDILDAGKELIKQGRRNSLTKLTRELVVSELSAGTEGNEDWAVVEKTTIFNFVRPLGGMFIWVRFNFTTHPLASKFATAKLSRALFIYWTRKPFLLIVAPGFLFAPTEEIREKDSWNCFRLCFAAVEKNEITDITKRFVNGAQSFWRIRDASQIDELLEEEDVSMGPDVGTTSVMGFC